jgi:hypothetical protein
MQEIADTYFPGAEVAVSRAAQVAGAPGDLREIALDTAARRPIRVEDLAAAAGVDHDFAEKTLTLLEHEGLLIGRKENGKTFYYAK